MKLRRVWQAVAVGAAVVLVGASAAYAADLKVDLELSTSGVQQNRDLGDFVGGEVKEIEVQVYVQGGGVTYPVAFGYDTVNVPTWVTGVETGSILGEGTANAFSSTVRVTAPCVTGSFGGGTPFPNNNKIAGSSVQYTVNGWASNLVQTAWVNLKGNVTDADTVACGGGGATDDPPVADAGGPYSGDEGEAIALDGTGSTDDGSIVSYKWTINDSTGDAGIDCSFDDDELAEPELTCDDDGTFPVTLEVTDDATPTAQTDTDTVNVVVSNVGPEVATPTVESETDCQVEIEATYSDDGLNDSHTAVIDWGDGDSDDPATLTSDGAKSGTGTVSGTHTYGAPGTYDIEVTVEDDDGDDDSATLDDYNNDPDVVYPLSPMDIAGKTFKSGSVIPVKISVTGCTSGLGTVTISITNPNLTPKAAGNSNVDDIMRYTSTLPGYIYNWQTKGAANGTYTVGVEGLPGGPYTTEVTLVKTK